MTEPCEYDSRDREEELTVPLLPGEESDLSVFDVEDPLTGTIDDDMAQWVIGKLCAKDEEMARIRQQAEAMIADVQRDKDGLLYRFGEVLKDWTRRRLALMRKGARSVKTLTGTAAFRTVPGRIVQVDPEKALAWAKAERPDLIREVVNVKGVPHEEAVIQTTGQVVTVVPDGFSWVPERETFDVKGLKSDRKCKVLGAVEGSSAELWNRLELCAAGGSGE